MTEFQSLCYKLNKNPKSLFRIIYAGEKFFIAPNLLPRSEEPKSIDFMPLDMAGMVKCFTGGAEQQEGMITGVDQENQTIRAYIFPKKGRGEINIEISVYQIIWLCARE